MIKNNTCGFGRYVVQCKGPTDKDWSNLSSALVDNIGKEHLAKKEALAMKDRWVETGLFPDHAFRIVNGNF